jgi:hypothetical protein
MGTFSMTMAVANWRRERDSNPLALSIMIPCRGGTLVPAQSYYYGLDGLVGARSHRHLALPGRCAPVRWTPVFTEHNERTLQATLQRASVHSM